jgi:hypothetical protein
VKVYASIGGAHTAPVRGPADLAPCGTGDTVFVLGTPSPEDAARWSSAIGMAAMRGATVYGRSLGGA